MHEKSDYEDVALQALCVELRARGHDATIITRPDADPQHPLTVDALFAIDGEEWAIDHCLLSRPPLLTPALNAAETALKDKLGALAREHGCLISVSYLPQTGERGTKWGEDYYNKLIEMAKEAIQTGAFVTGADGCATAAAVPTETPDVSLVAFTSMTTNPSIGSQIELGLRAPLLKKLDGQFRVAKDAGYRTALLLDQQPRPGSHTVWLGGPTTIAAVANGIMRNHRESNPKVLDQVWLRPALPTSALEGPSVHLLIA
ncbi:hypothetical protein [Streptomyces sp. NPDC002550]